MRRPLAAVALALTAAALALGALALAPAGEAQETGAFVSIRDSAYDPPLVRVVSGQRVTWRWDGTNTRHSVTADPGQAETFDSDPGEGPLAVAHAQGETFSHVFTRPGEYRYHDKVSCAPATSSSSCASGMTGRVIVENRAPSAALAVSPPTAQTGQEVRFDASGSSDPDGGIVSYAFDLDGDGVHDRSGPQAVVTRSYTQPGTYPVSVQVTDAHGASDRREATLVVEAPPPGAPGAPPSGPGARLLVAPRQPLATLKRGGVSMLVTCARACQVTASAAPAGATRRARAAQATAIVPAGGSASLDVALARRARSLLERGRSARTAISLTAVSGDGVAETSTEVVALRALRRGPSAAVGISEQRPPSFDDPLLRALGLRHARLITPWNSIFTERSALDDWLAAAARAGLEPFVAFERDRSSRCPERPCAGPSVAEYTAALRAFRAAYPQVRTISPWNEANHDSQPTARRPRLAAAYFDATRRVCRRCRIVAADVLDSPNLPRWIRSFRRAARAKPTLWGLHNYSDTNRFRSRGTLSLLRAVGGEVWLTETGGVVRFQTGAGVEALPYDEARAARSIDYLFQLAARYPRRIRRIYLYQWRKNFPADRFDAGLVGMDGLPRPGYEVLRQVLRARGSRR